MLGKRHAKPSGPSYGQNPSLSFEKRALGSPAHAVKSLPEISHSSALNSSATVIHVGLAVSPAGVNLWH